MNGLCLRGEAGYCEEQDAPGGEAREHRGSAGRSFHGPGGFCESDSEDWTERCLTDGCALRHTYSFECRPAHEPKPPDRPQW